MPGVRLSDIRKNTHFWPAIVGFNLILAAVGCRGGQIQERHASVVDHYLPTPRLPADRAAHDPSRALGPPDGRTVALAEGGALALRFFRPIGAGPGPDLRVIEIGGDGARAKIAASDDGERYREWLEPAEAGRGSLFDLAELGLESAAFVRIRGVDPSDGSDDPGFDLDALEALH